MAYVYLIENIGLTVRYFKKPCRVCVTTLSSPRGLESYPTVTQHSACGCVLNFPIPRPQGAGLLQLVPTSHPTVVLTQIQ